MRRLFKWIGITLGSLIGLIVVVVAVFGIISSTRLNRTYDATVPALTIPTDSESLAAGEHLYMTRGCGDCHGSDLGGAPVVEDLMFGRIHAPNLTTGEGGIGGSYSDQDLARAIWYGLRPDGSPLIVMPSESYHPSLDAVHVGQLIAYLRSAPPIDRDSPRLRTGPILWVMHTLKVFPVAPAEVIDLAAPPRAPVAVAATTEYGATIAAMCSGCHGAELAGFNDPLGATTPNLTPHSSGLASWSEGDFIRSMREGVRPDGSAIDEAMPWRSIGRMNDLELQALWAYLSSLEPLPAVAQ